MNHITLPTSKDVDCKHDSQNHSSDEQRAFDYVAAIFDAAKTADSGSSINIHDAVKAIHQAIAHERGKGGEV